MLKWTTGEDDLLKILNSLEVRKTLNSKCIFSKFAKIKCVISKLVDIFPTDFDRWSVSFQLRIFSRSCMPRDQKSLFGAISPGRTPKHERGEQPAYTPVYETAVVQWTAATIRLENLSKRTALECVTRWHLLTSLLWHKIDFKIRNGTENYTV